MTATVHPLPMAPLITERGYNERLGRRVAHRHYHAYGRLSGDYRYDRVAFWLEVECDDGRFWWTVPSIEFLGPIPAIPCPRGRSA